MSRVKALFRTTAVILTLFYIYLAFVEYKLSLVNPHGKLTNFEQHLEKMDGPDSISLFSLNNHSYIEALGPNNDLLVPSGPMSRIFNDKGVLLDWCSDIGDSLSYVEKWQPRVGVRAEMHKEEVVAWIKSNK